MWRMRLDVLFKHEKETEWRIQTNEEIKQGAEIKMAPEEQNISYAQE